MSKVALGIYYATLRTPDLVKSRHWYLQAALQGDGWAMYEIEFSLLLGEGGDADPLKPSSGWRKRPPSTPGVPRTLGVCSATCTMMDSLVYREIRSVVNTGAACPRGFGVALANSLATRGRGGSVLTYESDSRKSRVVEAPIVDARRVIPPPESRIRMVGMDSTS